MNNENNISEETWRDLEKMDVVVSSDTALPDPISMLEFLKGEFPEDIPVVQGLFDLARKVMIVGKSKQGKTFFALMLVLCMAAGRNLCQLLIPKALRVLYINYELHPRSLHRRLKDIREGFLDDITVDLENLHLLNLRGFACSPSKIVDHIIDKAKELGSQVILLDPLYLLIDGNENDSKTASELVKQIDRIIRETQAAFVYVHHDTKGNFPGDRSNVDRGSGSGVYGRHWDAQIALTEHAESEYAVVVEFSSRDYASLEPITMERDPKKGCLVCSSLLAYKRTRQSDRQNEPSLERQDMMLNIAKSFLAHQLASTPRVSTAELQRHLKMNFKEVSGRRVKDFVQGLKGLEIESGKAIKMTLLSNNHNYFEWDHGGTAG